MTIKGRVLLVIDDEVEFCGMMQRALRKHFDAVHVATSSAQAPPLLESEPITHVVCDLFLGEGEPLGHELMRGWRRRKPSIRYLALFTGSSLDAPPVGDDIDAVFRKPGGLTELMRVLKSRAA